MILEVKSGLFGLLSRVKLTNLDVLKGLFLDSRKIGFGYKRGLLRFVRNVGSGVLGLTELNVFKGQITGF